MQASSVFPRGQTRVGVDPSGKGNERAERPTPTTSAGTSYPDINSLANAEKLGAEAAAVAPALRFSKHGTFQTGRITHPGLE